MSRKIDIFLLASTKMSQKKEHECIRFPRRAREYFGFTNNSVVIGKGEAKIGLQVKKALAPDVKRLEKMLSSEKIFLEDAQRVGFVSRSIYNRINKPEGDSIWISEGIEDITIGADPEFGLINGLHLVRGNKIIPKSGKFGSDGPAAELRPDPNTNHHGLVQTIRELFLNPPAGADKYLWKGGATFTDTKRVYWFGGHIHLGRPAAIKPEGAVLCYRILSSILDHLLALPLLRFDTPNPQRRRNGCSYGYGKAGTLESSGSDASIRIHYPTCDRFEYRVLSGIWLTHPVLAKIVLGAAKCIAESAYLKLANKNYDYSWISQPISKDGMLNSFGIKDNQKITQAINSCLPGGATPGRIKAWERQIRSLERFDDYSEELEALISLTKADPRKVRSGLDLNIRKNWYRRTPLVTGEGIKILQKKLETME